MRPAERRARSWKIRQSCRASPGHSTALLILMMRPSTCVTVPSSSSCRLPGSTMSACRAVSLRKKSIAAKNSSLSRHFVTNELSGSDTFGLKQIEMSPLISPASIFRNISYASTPGPGRSLSWMPHTDGDVPTVLRVADVAPAWKLIALLSVLASTLPVGLADDRAVAALGLADAAGGQDEVDRAEGVLHAIGVVFDAAGVEEKAGLCGAPPFRGLEQRPLRDASHLRGACQRPLPTVFPDRVEPHRVGVDEGAIDPAALDHDLEHAGEQRRVAPGFTGR